MKPERINQMINTIDTIKEQLNGMVSDLNDEARRGVEDWVAPWIKKAVWVRVRTPDTDQTSMGILLSIIDHPQTVLTSSLQEWLDARADLMGYREGSHV